MSTGHYGGLPDAWEDAVALVPTGKAWTERMAMNDLRWWVDRMGDLRWWRDRYGPRAVPALPTLRELAARWRWKSLRQVSALVKDVRSWADVHGKKLEASQAAVAALLARAPKRAQEQECSGADQDCDSADKANADNPPEMEQECSGADQDCDTRREGGSHAPAAPTAQAHFTVHSAEGVAELDPREPPAATVPSPPAPPAPEPPQDLVQLVGSEIVEFLRRATPPILTIEDLRQKGPKVRFVKGIGEKRFERIRAALEVAGLAWTDPPPKPAEPLDPLDKAAADLWGDLWRQLRGAAFPWHSDWGGRGVRTEQRALGGIARRCGCKDATNLSAFEAAARSYLLYRNSLETDLGDRVKGPTIAGFSSDLAAHHKPGAVVVVDAGPRAPPRGSGPRPQRDPDDHRLNLADWALHGR